MKRGEGGIRCRGGGGSRGSNERAEGKKVCQNDVNGKRGQSWSGIESMWPKGNINSLSRINGKKQEKTIKGVHRDGNTGQRMIWIATGTNEKQKANRKNRLEEPKRPPKVSSKQSHRGGGKKI